MLIHIFSNANQNGIAFVNILIISVTLIVVAVPEGLRLNVDLYIPLFIRIYRRSPFGGYACPGFCDETNDL
jgi:hypothetical protein